MMRYLSGLSIAAILVSVFALGGCSGESDTGDTPKKQSTAEQDEPETKGQIVKVLRPWARVNPVPGRPAAVFFDIENTAAEDDTLIGVSLPEGGRAELHTHKHEGGVMRMLRMDSLIVPAGGRIAFQPGSHHVMLFDVPNLPIGGRVTINLQFEKAGEIEVLATIRPITAAGPGEGAEKP